MSKHNNKPNAPENKKQDAQNEDLKNDAPENKNQDEKDAQNEDLKDENLKSDKIPYKKIESILNQLKEVKNDDLQFIIELYFNSTKEEKTKLIKHYQKNGSHLINAAFNCNDDYIDEFLSS